MTSTDTGLEIIDASINFSFSSEKRSDDILQNVRFCLFFLLDQFSELATTFLTIHLSDEKLNSDQFFFPSFNAC